MDFTSWLGSVDPTDVGVVLLVLAGVAVFAVKAWPIARRVVRTIDMLADLPERLTKIEVSLGIVRGEMTPNGGESVKDTVDFLAKDSEARQKEAQRRDERLNRLEVAVFHNGPTA